MRELIKTYIADNRMIVRGDTVWVAFSGGADSSCLLHILNELKSDMGFTLKAVHINHNLRGDESDEDERFCKKMCRTMGVKLEIFHADVKNYASEKGMTIEQAGRSIRYDIFERKCEGKIALAHNLNDNAETVLMNLLRGSGMVGMCGIRPISGKYIRPLIKTTRKSIEVYCSANKISYVDDSSNSETIYFRNAVRHKILPLLNDITGKDAVSILDRASESFFLDNEFIESVVDEVYSKFVKEEPSKAIIDNIGVKTLHKAIAARLVRKAVGSIKGDLKDIEARHTSLLLEMIGENRTGAAVKLPGDVNTLVQFDKTLVYIEKPAVYYEYSMPVQGKIFIKEKKLDVIIEICDACEIGDPKGDVHYFSASACGKGFTIRNRRNGDIIKPWKGRGSVKLKKYFIDKKIDRTDRNNKLLIACGDKVAYIEGMAYGKDFMPDGESKVIRVKIERR
jgi:tRNA(Ile)-lysidine synthase